MHFGTFQLSAEAIDQPREEPAFPKVNSARWMWWCLRSRGCPTYRTSSQSSLPPPAGAAGVKATSKPAAVLVTTVSVGQEHWTKRA